MKITEMDPATKAMMDADEAAKKAAAGSAEEDAAKKAAEEGGQDDAAKKAAEEEEAKKAAGSVDEIIIEGEKQDEDDKPAPQWVRDLRVAQKELVRENKELKAQLETHKPAAIAVGNKPTLEGCGYDDAKFETELTTWYERKRKIDDEAAAKKTAEEQEQKSWQTKLGEYGKQKESIKVSDFDDAEAVAQTALSVTQQGIIVAGATNAALIMYALGKHPAKLAEVAAIKDPVQFAFAISKLEDKVKTASKRDSAPPPEKQLQSGTGGTSVSGTVDSHLEQLRAEAEKSGDYTKVTAYKRQQREKQQQK